MQARRVVRVVLPESPLRYLPMSFDALWHKIGAFDSITKDIGLFWQLRRWTRLSLRTTWMLKQDEILAAYDHFDPHRTVFSAEESPEAKRARSLEDAHVGNVSTMEVDLVSRFGVLADKANFDQVENEWVRNAAKGGAAPGGITTQEVDTDEYATLKLWVRGRAKGDRITAEKKQTRRMKRKVMMNLLGENGEYSARGGGHTADTQFAEEDLFHTALLVTRKHGEPHLHIQMFRDVPVAQIELLFPGVQIAMSNVDRVKIAVLGGLGGVGAAIKAATVAVAGGADLSNGLDAKDAGLVLASGVLCAVAFQIWSQFQLKRAAFSSALTSALYFGKLGQNRLVIESLVNETEKQEMKEAMLAYAVVLEHEKEAPGIGFNKAELQTRAASFLATSFPELDHLNIGFDAPDALEKLLEMGLVAGVVDEDPTRETFRCLPLHEAVEKAKANCEHVGYAFVNSAGTGSEEEQKDAGFN
jgi:hypothetical protein|tara:strand:+ start:940 stop:2355 length:1416 start_codon:yes stop_codon:yes gene_type:complete